MLQGGTGTATPSLIEGTDIVISGTWPNQNVSFGLASYLVAALPVATEGALAYASNGRKSGEIAGHGTGIPVYWSANGSPPYAGWYNFSGVEVQA